MQAKVAVLFVCMGNICRSPMAEGVFRHMLKHSGLADAVITDSAGTHAYHIGEPPDQRAQSTSNRYGIDISDLRARQVRVPEDFYNFHYLLAMDRDNFKRLQKVCPQQYRSRLYLFMQFAGAEHSDVPDPYYGDQRDFEQVYRLVTAASQGLIDDIRRRHLDY